MTDSWLPALIAAIGAIGAASIAVLASRGRLHRIEVLFRVLKDLPSDDPARADLAKVLAADAEALRDAQESGLLFAMKIATVALLLAITFSTFGDALEEWAPAVHFALLLSATIAALIAALVYVLLGIRAARRFGRFVLNRRRNPGK